MGHSRVALIDADVYSYACGFATQKTLRGVFEGDETLVEAEPVENALALVKGSLAKLGRFLDAHGYTEHRYFLTGKENFRNEVAKVAVYKGNRVQEKPVHYKAIREYLTRRYGAETIRGREADDEIAALSYELGHDPDKVIIVSQDKDLLTVPGLLYNPRKEKLYKTSPDMARTREYRQILMGDTADNIPGCYKVGKIKAARLITKDMSPDRGVAVLRKEFEESKKRSGCPYKDRDTDSVIEEMGQLVHLKRFEGDIWKL